MEQQSSLTPEFLIIVEAFFDHAAVKISEMNVAKDKEGLINFPKQTFL